MTDTEALAKRSREASWQLQSLSTEKKNEALLSVRRLMEAKREEIVAANKRDLAAAEEAVAAGSLSSALFKRLDVEGKDGAKFNALLQGLDDVRQLDDPVGKVSLATRLDDGLDMYRVACPVGVICIIFEARPEVVVQISSLCLKSGNAVILKGGKEAANSNAVLVDIFRQGLAAVPGVPVDLLQLVASRDEVATLLSMDRYVDLVIPRGSNSLVTYVQSNTRIPVLGHADGICSVYLHKDADLEKAINVVVDSKTNYTAACNTAETLLVHAELLSTLLPRVGEALAKAGVELRADVRCRPHLHGAKEATEEDYRTEFLDLIMAVKAVDSLEDAILHINQHGSHHTDCIITEDLSVAEKFMSLVDSAGVYHNASTRFADGFRYGFGAEIGVSTNKTHARGPVGLEGLMIYKYRMYGSGQTVAPYGKERQFKHTPIAPSDYRKLG